MLNHAETECIDVNECVHFKDQAYGLCENLPGSYNVTCRTGFEQFFLSCQDIIECQDPTLNNCQHECINSIGSYHWTAKVYLDTKNSSRVTNGHPQISGFCDFLKSYRAENLRLYSSMHQDYNLKIPV